MAVPPHCNDRAPEAQDTGRPQRSGSAFSVREIFCGFHVLSSSRFHVGDFMNCKGCSSSPSFVSGCSSPRTATHGALWDVRYRTRP
eukprot:1594031-Rhodomonas_salina.1